MASPQLKTTPARPRTLRDARGHGALAARVTPFRPRTQFDFRARIDRAADHRHAIAILGPVAIGVVGAIVAIVYLGGLIAATIAATAVAALIGFGNWILTNIIEL